VKQAAQLSSEQRFQTLETIREFGLEQLQTNGELEKTRHAHALWCLAVAEDIAPEFIGPETFSPDGVAALGRLAAERDNVRAALDWATVHGEAEIALRLVYAFKIVWVTNGHFGEGKIWSVPVELQASMLITLAWMTSWLDDIEAARSQAEEGLALARSIENAIQEYWALRVLGWLAFETGDLDQACVWFEQSLAVARSMDDRRWEPSALTDLGGVAFERGDFEQAEASFEAALSIARTVGDREAISTSAGGLAIALAKQGRTQRAAGLLREALSLIQASVHAYHLVWKLSDSAMVATDLGRAETAARLLGACSSLRATAEIPMTRGEERGEARTIAAIREALSEAAFEAAWSGGSTLPLNEAIVEADAMLAELAEEPEPSAPGAQTAPGGLTPRELDVLRLLVEGLSDKEIAQALGITRSTASKHVEIIRGKLGVPSRTAAATYATRHGLI
jgi:DNA-binding CsgD family transcriptional regulator/tetratricopeptide (TPR) repeat protein